MKYFLTIIDDCSRFTWTYLLKSKSNAFLVRYRLSLVNALSRFAQIMLRNWLFLSFYRNVVFSISFHGKCIKHQHLLNVARALFFQSKVPIQFWGECLQTATFLINLLPSPVLKFKSPYKLVFHKAPDYHSLKVFGCLCFASSLPSHRNKFFARAIPSIFMGYPVGYKGYKLLNLATKQFFISRDVIFHEDTFPFASLASQTIEFPIQPSLILPQPMLHSPPLDSTTPTEPSTEPDIMPPQEPHLPDQPVLRRFTRVSRPPPHLGDFHYHAVTNQYDISQYVNYSQLSLPYYSQLSLPYKNFICQISAVPEPSFYH